MEYLLIVDIAICLIVFSLLFVFFMKKRHLKVFCIFAVLVVVTVAIDIASMFVPDNVLVVSRQVTAGVLLCAMITIIIVYQSDFKMFVQKLSKPKSKNLDSEVYGNDDELAEATNEILDAVQAMAKKDTGALILLTPSSVEDHIMETGVPLNAEVSAQLLECIFNTKAPLHDGAVVIKGNKILASSCFLPLTENVTVTKEVGTRHRAAIGITEESDVLAIVVSEETGIISIAKKGILTRYMTIERLKEEIEKVYGINVNTNHKRKLN